MNPLLIPELFHNILDHVATAAVEDPIKTLEERRTFAALARTCHAFSEPSLDFLWRRLDSLVPLIRSFADVVDETRATTPPSAHERRVMGRYVHRIQELVLEREPLSREFILCTNVVLPNLRTLVVVRPLRSDLRNWRSINVWPIVSRRPLFCPRIDTLDVEGTPASEQELMTFLDDYLPLYPNLKLIGLNFTLGYNPVSEASIPSFSQALCRHDDWEHVEIPHPVVIDDVALRQLGRCSTLKVVSLFMEEKQTGTRACFGPEDRPFGNVQKMTLIVQSHLDCATELLRAHDQAFYIFCATVHVDLTTAEQVSALMAAIASGPRGRSLRSLVVERDSQCTPSSFTMTGLQGLSYKALRPTCTLVHLRELVVNLRHPISLHDDEFARLVCNWPRLEILELVGSGLSSLTLNALVFLASCPDLKSVCLSVDARQVPSPEAYAVGCPHVTDLEFPNSPIEDAELVEPFLFRHAPLVRTVDAGYLGPLM